MGKLFPDAQLATFEMAKGVGLSHDEYRHVCTKLDRAPTWAELGIFSAMFSEHCSYKSSKRFFKRFPTTGKRVLQGPGENAGILDIGHGWAVAFKMESHNHPSFIEPYQGAATGVGGILRDIFTMGARPIAMMDSLCFGSLDFDRTKSIVRNVVKGVGDYGNSVGVPNIAGQTFFHSCYTRNPLVNAFTLGLVRSENIFRGIASGEGNLLIYVGAKTGRDGVHGATMASREFSTEQELERPAVQVGDPFTEKLLLEATLEAMRENLMVGIQDMGAAGLTSSSFEMAARGKSGLEIDLDKIPTREKGMSAYELCLSESQERMLMVAEESKWPRIQALYEKWDLHAEIIGKVVPGNRVVMQKDGKKVIDLPVSLVVDPPMAERPGAAPGDLRQRWFIDRNRVLQAPLEAKLHAVLEDLHFADPKPLISQYDSMVGNRTVSENGDDSGVLRIREITESPVKLALKADCNPRVCWLSPREGGRRAVAESALNVAIRGAEPIGITDCLNFGSPENSEVMWQFEEAIEGISEACEALKIPVISGNVSFYNETDGAPIYPTPMIGMVGMIQDSLPIPPVGVQSTELELGLLGLREGGLGGSLFAQKWFKRDCGKPEDTDLKLLERVIRCCQSLRRKKFSYSLHDISDGGLVLTALEMAFRSRYPEAGVEIHVPRDCDIDGFLFGESVPRVLVAYEAIERTELEMLANQAGIGFEVVGSVDDSAQLRIKQGGATVFQLPDLKSEKAKWSTKWNRLFEF